MALAFSDVCEVDHCPSDRDVPCWLCVSCGCTFCDDCWKKERAHKPGKVGLDNLPHEKTSKDVHTRLQAVFGQTEHKSELLKLHIEDEETLWFAIERDDDNRCRFTDRGRYTNLMMMTKQPTPGSRYPLLVSFVGQTGAGKSTLIKMLVSLKEANLSASRDDFFKSPVTGSIKDDRSPTSGDVHLYIDPHSAFSEFPMLYADCEGLEGGERPPQAQSIKNTLIKKVKQRDSVHVREMIIPTDKGKLGTREWAVRNVYPRLLYTFSDVVCFVLKNTRTFESVALQLLLEWAATSLQSSVNQAALPQAVIVLNASDPTMDDEEWDVTKATERLMEQVKSAIHQNEQIKKYSDFWLARGKICSTTEELLRCYYNSIRVVRIPAKGRNMQIKQQIDKLHATLAEACNHSIAAKLAARQFCTIDELDRYLQAAFDHFAAKPEQPFNFVEVALKANPIPQSFSEHIFTLANASSNMKTFASPPEALDALMKLSPIIASCITLDCLRYGRPGRPADLFERHYTESCTGAINTFHDLFLPCSFVGKKQRLCVNRMNSHDKGHQDENGLIIGAGPFQCDFDVEKSRKDWLSLIYKELQLLDSQIDDYQTRPGFTAHDRRKITHNLHRARLTTTFANNARGLLRNSTCYACLMELAQHPLPCGHMLCTECVKMLGTETDKSTFTVKMCPFENTKSLCSIRFKPNYAGVRILSLDGGGIRGIVELESLRAIERVLGPNLPVRSFFDLIVGTSTGGIIALGLGVKQWTVDQCADRFVRLCTQAFTPKAMNKFVPDRSALAALRIKWNKYRTRPLYEVLKQEFGNDPLYGKVPDDTVVRDTKVCVTTTPVSLEYAMAVGNYARQSEEDHWYKYEKGDFIRIWQAAAATSAAPSYFKKFTLSLNEPIGGSYRTMNQFLDGALYFNNPVRLAFNERRFLWPDVADMPPDIVLSLGTGQNAQALSTEISRETTVRIMPKSRALCLPESKFARLKKAFPSNTDKQPSFLKNMSKALTNMLDSILDAEKEFKIFQQEHNHFGGFERYIRLNPDLGMDPPALDNKAQMLNLKDTITNLFKTPAYELIAERIAYRLVASSFYFEKTEPIEHNEVEGQYLCKGRVACRFEGTASDMKSCLRNLGKFFREQSTASLRPFLAIANNKTGEGGRKIELDQKMIDAMINDANFCIAEDLVVKISDKLSPTTLALGLRPSRSAEPELFPLSGFPRYLITENASTATRLQKRAEILKTKIKKSELLVGNSIYHYLLAAADEEEAEAKRVSEEKTKAASLSRPSLSSITTDETHNNKDSPSSSMTSLHETLSEFAKPTLNVLRGKRTASHTSESSPTSRTKSSEFARNHPPKHPLKKSSSAGIADIRATKFNKKIGYSFVEYPDSDDESLDQAFRRSRPQRPPGRVSIVDALDLNLVELPVSSVKPKSTSQEPAPVEADFGSKTYRTLAMDDDSDSDGPPYGYFLRHQASSSKV